MSADSIMEESAYFKLNYGMLMNNVISLKEHAQKRRSKSTHADKVYFECMAHEYNLTSVEPEYSAQEGMVDLTDMVEESSFYKERKGLLPIDKPIPRSMTLSGVLDRLKGK